MDASYSMLSIIAFFVTLFVYVHVSFHLRVSDDLDVYHIDYVSKDRLHEMCDLRQPVVFRNVGVEDAAPGFALPALLRAYGDFDVHVRRPNNDGGVGVAFPIKLNHANALFDQSGGVFAEGNRSFLNETGLVKHLRRSEASIKPSLSASAEYDLLLGARGAHTPLRYRIEYRNYYSVASGRVTVRLASPRNERHLQIDRDYGELEFSSRQDPWGEPKGDLRKVKFLELTLAPHHILSVPPYWMHSIRFDEIDTVVVAHHYTTFMSRIATAPDVAMHVMQTHNTKYVIPHALCETKLPYH